MDRARAKKRGELCSPEPEGNLFKWSTGSAPARLSILRPPSRLLSSASPTSQPLVFARDRSQIVSSFHKCALRRPIRHSCFRGSELDVFSSFLFCLPSVCLGVGQRGLLHLFPSLLRGRRRRGRSSRRRPRGAETEDASYATPLIRFLSCLEFFTQKSPPHAFVCSPSVTAENLAHVAGRDGCAYEEVGQFWKRPVGEHLLGFPCTKKGRTDV